MATFFEIQAKKNEEARKKNVKVENRKELQAALKAVGAQFGEADEELIANLPCRIGKAFCNKSFEEIVAMCNNKAGQVVGEIDEAHAFGVIYTDSKKQHSFPTLAFYSPSVDYGKIAEAKKMAEARQKAEELLQRVNSITKKLGVELSANDKKFIMELPSFECVRVYVDSCRGRLDKLSEKLGAQIVENGENKVVYLPDIQTLYYYIPGELQFQTFAKELIKKASEAGIELKYEEAIKIASAVPHEYGYYRISVVTSDFQKFVPEISELLKIRNEKFEATELLSNEKVPIVEISEKFYLNLDDTAIAVIRVGFGIYVYIPKG